MFPASLKVYIGIKAGASRREQDAVSGPNDAGCDLYCFFQVVALMYQQEAKTWAAGARSLDLVSDRLKDR